MKLIVGIGNPGEEYKETRHNIGFLVVDRLARELGATTATFEEDKKYKSLIAHAGDVILVKPLTFVNNTGIAVESVTKYYKLKPSDVWVIHDDIDLPIGKLRIRLRGGSAGHHGIDSLIKHLGTDEFVRFRLGVGRGLEDKKKHTDRHLHHRSVIQFVLSRFTNHEAGELKHLIKHGAEAVRIALLEGLDKAANRFN